MGKYEYFHYHHQKSGFGAYLDPCLPPPLRPGLPCTAMAAWACYTPERTAGGQNVVF